MRLVFRTAGTSVVVNWGGVGETTRASRPQLELPAAGLGGLDVVVGPFLGLDASLWVDRGAGQCGFQNVVRNVGPAVGLSARHRTERDDQLLLEQRNHHYLQEYQIVIM